LRTRFIAAGFDQCQWWKTFVSLEMINIRITIITGAAMLAVAGGSVRATQIVVNGDFAAGLADWILAF